MPATAMEACESNTDGKHSVSQFNSASWHHSSQAKPTEGRIMTEFEQIIAANYTQGELDTATAEQVRAHVRSAPGELQAETQKRAIELLFS